MLKIIMVKNVFVLKIFKLSLIEKLFRFMLSVKNNSLKLIGLINGVLLCLKDE